MKYSALLKIIKITKKTNLNYRIASEMKRKPLHRDSNCKCVLLQMLISTLQNVLCTCAEYAILHDYPFEFHAVSTSFHRWCIKWKLELLLASRTIPKTFTRDYNTHSRAVRMWSMEVMYTLLAIVAKFPSNLINPFFWQGTEESQKQNSETMWLG